jgi:nucleoside-diphosphate-sugar epimerase
VRALVRDRARWAAPAGVEAFEGDLLRPQSLVGVESGIDTVVHCAGLLGKWGTAEEQLHAVNVGGTLQLLERFAARELGCFVHLSAGGVTGPTPFQAVDERYDCRPSTAYERTKLEAERRLLARARELRLPALVLRPTFTYGPGDPHKLALFRAVLRGRYVFIGDGRSVNHPVYVDDLVRGILLALERAEPGEVYILGGERPVTKRELIDTIADCLGVARPRLGVPRWIAAALAVPLEGAGRLFGFEPLLTRSRVMMMADNFGYSIDKARRALGYEPRTTLQEGIAKTINSYRESGQL